MLELVQGMPDFRYERIRELLWERYAERMDFLQDGAELTQDEFFNILDTDRAMTPEEFATGRQDLLGRLHPEGLPSFDPLVRKTARFLLNINLLP
jgi:hypothetical protein